MFCINCGAKLPDGSKFCMECGTKLSVEIQEPVPEVNSWNKPLETLAEQETVEVKRPTVSFDWSNVKEESHKKEVPEVHSPWGTTGLSEKELFAEESAPTDDMNRTMNFINILTKERDARAQAAEEEARAVTERQEPEADYSAFKEAPSFYVPPLYEDLDGPTETPFDLKEEVPFEEPEYEEPKFEEPKFEVPEFEEPELEETVFFDAPSEHHEEEDFEMYHTSSFDGPDMSATEDYTELEASLAAILDAGAGKSSVDEPVDLFEGVEKAEESVEDLYLDVEDESPEVVLEEEPEVQVEIEEPKEEEVHFFEDTLADFAPKHGGLDFEEELEVEAEDDLDDDAFQELEKLYITEDDIEETLKVEETEEQVVEEPVLEPVAEDESVESEIEALKRRLAELTGTTEEPVAEEPVFEAPVFEEPAAEEPAFEAPVFEEPAAEEPVFEAPVFEEPVAEEPVFEAPVFEEPAAEEPAFEPVASEFEEEFEVELSDEESEEEDGISIDEVLAEAEEPEVEPEVEEPAATEEPEESDALSIDELEKALSEEAGSVDEEPEATKKIDKFYTLYRKNEEFQKLLDEEFNKLQSEDTVPHVEDFVPVEVVKDEPVAEPETFEAPIVEETIIEESVIEETIEDELVVEPETVAPVQEEVEKVEEAPSKAELKAAKKAAKKADKAVEEDDEESSGGGALTVIAVIIAALLVILLAIILVLNFAPDSAIAMRIDSVIETITSYFSSVDTFNGNFLL